MPEVLPRPFSSESTLPTRLALLALICLGALLSSASAQTSRGTVTGTVTDPNKAPAPSAIVVLINAKGGPTRETTTNAQGLYLFDEVDPGTYSVIFSATEYPKLTKTDVRVAANQTATINTELLIGGIDSFVSVDGTAGNELQREAPVRGGNISDIQITDLPFANRNPALLGLTLPGVSTNRGGFGDSTFSVNGGRDRSNNFLLDSTENNDISIAGEGLKITNPDSVEEVSLQTSNFDAEFGRSGGAIVNVITKSGSNKLRGTLSYLLDSRRDDAITSSESRNPVIAASGLPFGIENIYSFSLGGPIRKNRTFFFTSYQEDRRRSNAQLQLLVPTAAGRAFLRQVFPAGSSSNADLYLSATEKTVGLASPSNVALGIVNGVDRGNVEFATFFRNIPNNDTDKQLLARVDHRLTERDNFSARFLLDRETVPFGGTLGGTEFTPTQAFPGFDADNKKRYYNMLLTNTHVFSSSVTNVTRIAYNRIDLQFPVTDPSGPGGTLPRISFSNTSITSLGTSTNFPQGRIANNYVLQDTVTFLKGRHTFRTGIDLLRQMSTQAAPYSPRGLVTYGLSAGFNSFANFMDDFGGNGGSVVRDIGSAVYSPRMSRTAAFFQDRWRATSAVTVSIGLRYEYFGTPFNAIKTPAYTGLFNVDPATRLGPYALPNKIKADYNNFAPNIGLAYSPSYSSGVLGLLLGERKSVLRAGYYIGYDSFFNNITSNAATSSPNIVSTRIDSSTTGRGTAAFLSMMPTTAATLTPLSAQTLIDPNLVNPYYQRWSAGLQRQLAKKLVVDIAYVGSKGSKLYISEDANPQVRPELRLGTPADYPVCTPGSSLTTQATAAFPAGALCPLSGRYDNLQGSRLVRTNGGSSIYHAGQIEVKRPFAGNFIVTGSYTYSKLISNGDEIFGSAGKGIANQPQFQTPPVFFGDRLDRAVSLFDRTHRATITYVFQSPFLRNQRGIFGHIVGGWEISGITTFESGVPYTVFNGADADGIGGDRASDRPDVNPNGKRGVRAVPVVDTQGSILFYTNPDDNNVQIDPSTAYFIGNPVYDPSKTGSVPRVGTLGRNTERTPGLRSFDLAFMKRSRISESRSIEFRVETYNIFNHPQYGQGSVSPFAPTGNPGGANFIAATVNSATTAGRFLKPNTIGSDGGGRVIRYQIKLFF